jgi:hypothetical protein
MGADPARPFAKTRELKAVSATDWLCVEIITLAEMLLKNTFSNGSSQNHMDSQKEHTPFLYDR